MKKLTGSKKEQKQSQAQVEELMEEHVQEPLKYLDMEEMIEAFFGLSNGEDDDIKEFENDPSIKRLQ